MRRYVTIIVSATVALSISMVGTGVVPGVLQAPTVAHAAGCSGTGCDGTDPVSTGCVYSSIRVLGAAIKNAEGGQIGEVYVDYSTGCQTKFAEVDNYIQSYSVPIVAETDSRDGFSRDNTVDGSFTKVYAPQYYSPQGQNCSGRGGVSAYGAIDAGPDNIGDAQTDYYC